MDPPAPDAPSPQERDMAIERLRDARSRGELDEAELLMRTQAIRNAASRAEIVRFTADLDRPRSPVGAEGRSWDVTLFGDVERSGPWRRDDNVALSLFGDVELELSEDAVKIRDVRIVAISPFGDIDLTVPDGTEVDVSGFTIFGSKRITVRETGGRRPAFTVRLRAFSLFGSIKVRSR